MRKPNTQDVLSCLSYTEWKATLDVLDELRSLIGATAGFRGPQSSWVRTKLNSLERQGFVEHRDVSAEDDPDRKRVAARGGRGHTEWKLTPAGLRKKNEQPASKEVPAGVLVPA